MFRTKMRRMFSKFKKTKKSSKVETQLKNPESTTHLPVDVRLINQILSKLNNYIVSSKNKEISYDNKLFILTVSGVIYSYAREHEPALPSLSINIPDCMFFFLYNEMAKMNPAHSFALLQRKHSNTPDSFKALIEELKSIVSNNNAEENTLKEISQKQKLVSVRSGILVLSQLKMNINEILSDENIAKLKNENVENDKTIDFNVPATAKGAFSEINNDVLCEIFSKFPVKEAVKLSRTSKFFNKLFNESCLLWQSYIKRDFSDQINEIEKNPSYRNNPKELYKTLKLSNDKPKTFAGLTISESAYKINNGNLIRFLNRLIVADDTFTLSFDFISNSRQALLNRLMHDSPNMAQISFGKRRALIIGFNKSAEEVEKFKIQNKMGNYVFKFNRINLQKSIAEISTITQNKRISSVNGKQISYSIEGLKLTDTTPVTYDGKLLVLNKTSSNTPEKTEENTITYQQLGFRSW